MPSWHQWKVSLLKSQWSLWSSLKMAQSFSLSLSLNPQFILSLVWILLFVSFIHSIIHSLSTLSFPFIPLSPFQMTWFSILNHSFPVWKESRGTSYYYYSLEPSSTWHFALFFPLVSKPRIGSNPLSFITIIIVIWYDTIGHDPSSSGQNNNNIFTWPVCSCPYVLNKFFCTFPM